jgi:hypothetical protein
MQIPKGDVRFFYDKIYSEIIGRESGWILSRLAAYPHKYLERNFKSNDKLKILEIQLQPALSIGGIFIKVKNLSEIYFSSRQKLTSSAAQRVFLFKDSPIDYFD